jgi:hypothetical protein
MEHCELCKLSFVRALWCRALNCPTTETREPAEADKQKLGWFFRGPDAKEGAHAIRYLKP